MTFRDHDDFERFWKLDHGPSRTTSPNFPIKERLGRFDSSPDVVVTFAGIADSGITPNGPNRQVSTAEFRKTPFRPRSASRSPDDMAVEEILFRSQTAFIPSKIACRRA